MAAVEWNGFSEDDLRKIKEQNGVAGDGINVPDSSKMDVVPSKKSTSELLTGARKSKKKKPTGSVKQQQQHSSNPVGSAALELNQMLSPPKVMVVTEASEARQVKLTTADQCSPVTQCVQKERQSADFVTLRLKGDGCAVEVVEKEKVSLPALRDKSTKVDVGRKNTTSRVESNGQQALLDCECNDSGYGGEVEHPAGGDSAVIACSAKKLSLEEFQIRQKMIEEQNKRRRAMLTKAIADRKKKTEAETEKLTHIQKELQRLDSLVSNDVAILRDQIEVASVDFNEIQKKYEKAEREFVEVKMELFQKMERKERLTEHLCTIIEENELRKARKLANLMAELELESLMEECESNGNPVLPQLISSNDVTYACCTTLRNPNTPTASPTKGKDWQPSDSLNAETEAPMNSVASVDEDQHLGDVRKSLIMSDENAQLETSEKETSESAAFVDIHL